MGSTSKEGFLRHRCPTHSGKLVNVKKDGAGGKGTWGKLLDTDSNSRIDQIDPNSDSNEVRATEFLIENSRIMLIRSNHDKHHSYVNLQTQAMFNNLVSLYSGLFLTQWQHFHHFMAQFTPPPNTQPHVHAAQVYISTWFIDLYVSNREAVKKLSYLTFNDRFFTELTPVSREYDRYLTLLNASIRPTHVKYTMDDAIYVPIIANTLNLEAERRNYFGIAGFDANESIFYGVIQIMKDRKCWNFSAISNGCTLGRPCWLLDWHADDRVCAWFRMEGNFDFVDVTLAYILGVACTPKLGARDVDEWQFFTNAVVLLTLLLPIVNVLTHEISTDLTKYVLLRLSMIMFCQLF